MQFRYDFGEKLDLSKFRKQALHYIKSLDNVSYLFVLPQYKVIAELIRNGGIHTAYLSVYEISRDKQGEISGATLLTPLLDTRFKEIKIIQEIWQHNPTTEGVIEFNAPPVIINHICDLVKVVHKIFHLKVFL